MCSFICVNDLYVGVYDVVFDVVLMVHCSLSENRCASLSPPGSEWLLMCVKLRLQVL